MFNSASAGAGARRRPSGQRASASGGAPAAALTEEAGELTPSLKTKNRVVLANWADIIAYLFVQKRGDAGD